MIDIGPAVTDEIIKFPRDLLGERQGESEILGRRQHAVQILELELGRTARHKIALHHAVAMQFQDPAFGKTAANAAT